MPGVLRGIITVIVDVRTSSDITDCFSVVLDVILQHFIFGIRRHVDLVLGDVGIIIRCDLSAGYGD